MTSFELNNIIGKELNRKIETQRTQPSHIKKNSDSFLMKSKYHFYIGPFNNFSSFNNYSDMNFSLNKITDSEKIKQIEVKKPSKFSKFKSTNKENECPNIIKCDFFQKEDLTFKRAKSENFTSKQTHLDIHNKLKEIIKLQTFIKNKLNKQKVKILIYIKKILIERQKSALKIQTNFRRFLCSNLIKKIFEMKEENYCIMYYKTANNMLMPMKKLTAVFQLEGVTDKDKVLKFLYNKMLKCFLLFIKKQSLIKDTYKIKFLCDGNQLIDTNFPYTTNRNGQIYNYIKANNFDECWYISNVCNKRKLNYSCFNFFPHSNYDFLIPTRKQTCPELKINNPKLVLGNFVDNLINRRKSM